MAHVEFTSVDRPELAPAKVKVRLVHHTGERSLDLENHMNVRHAVHAVVKRMEEKLPLPKGQYYMFTPEFEEDSALRKAGMETTYYRGMISVHDDVSWQKVRDVVAWSTVAA